jgi:alpha-glucosidase
MADTALPAALRTDPDGRDPQRTPMPWRAPQTVGDGAGFSTGRPWLPIGPDADRVNVATEQADTNSTLHLYRQLIQARRSRPPGGAHDVQLVGPDLLVVRHDTPRDTWLTVLNFATTPSSVPADILDSSASRRIVLSTDRSRTPFPDGESNLEVGPLEALIIDIEVS